MISEEQINLLKEQIQTIKEKKDRYVKSQKFEEAASLRDDEHRLQVELQALEKERREKN